VSSRSHYLLRSPQLRGITTEVQASLRAQAKVSLSSEYMNGTGKCLLDIVRPKLQRSTLSHLSRLLWWIPSIENMTILGYLLQRSATCDVRVYQRVSSLHAQTLFRLLLHARGRHRVVS
jgi:hypothetical protein